MISVVIFPELTIPVVLVSFFFSFLPDAGFWYVSEFFLVFNLGNKRGFGDLEDDEDDFLSSEKVFFTFFFLATEEYWFPVWKFVCSFCHI